MLPLSSCGALAWAMTYSFSSIAERYSISSVILLLTTLRYGVSRKPYLLVRANTASELIRPMFGPSGVSIVQTRRSEEHTSELQSLMRISYAVFCLTKKHTSKTFSYYNSYTLPLISSQQYSYLPPTT